MKRQEKVYFPRKARAPYFSTDRNNNGNNGDGIISATTAASRQLVPTPLNPTGSSLNNLSNAAATNINNNVNVNNANASSATTSTSTSSGGGSTWNEADAAAGGVNNSNATNDPNNNNNNNATSTRRIASVASRLPRVASETTPIAAGRAAILPTRRRVHYGGIVGAASNGMMMNSHTSGGGGGGGTSGTVIYEDAGGGGLQSSSGGGGGHHYYHHAGGGGGGGGGENQPQYPHSNHQHQYRNAQERTALAFGARPQAALTDNIVPDWRLRVRMRTVGVGLVLALNIGTDPPDTVKPHPCAVLQCWMDPRTVSRSKAKEWIGERLEQQYAVWQLARTARPLRYRRALDPTVEDVRNLCIQMRRQARNERILLHYNGHGVPRPTASGEIWVFDKNHTEYIPLAVADLKQWLGKPSMIVLDCSAAGVLLPYWNGTLPVDPATGVGVQPATVGPITDMEAQANQWVQDTIVLAPCSESQVLPMHPDYPADIFTACLTTPIPMALRWFVRRHPHTGLDFTNLPIPGKANDRKTPLGELNWIFTAVTDSIAWNVLPRALFQRLFRQDLLVASMFRNFLLADRILRSLGRTPVSHPPLPPGIANHPLWQAWDLVCENLLFQLAQEGVLPRRAAQPPTPTATTPGTPASSPSDESDEEGAGTADTGNETDNPPGQQQQQQQQMPPETVSNICISSPFFAQQLTAFEVWLDFIPIHKQRLAAGTLETPEQLPVVLQVLLSQTHRIRALVLLRRFLQLGPWAVNSALSLGIFPYILKLLQSPEYKSLLVSIWASILAFDPSCRVDLLKDGAFPHFVQHLMFGLTTGVGQNLVQAARERTLAAFCLAAATHHYPAGQAEAVRLQLHANVCALLSSYEQGSDSIGVLSNSNEDNAKDNEALEMHLPAHFRLWLIFCLANMIHNNPPIQAEAYASQVHIHVMERTQDESVYVRAGATYALGCFLGAPSSSRPTSRSPSMQEMASRSGPPKPGGSLAPVGNTLGAPSLANPILPSGVTGGLLRPQPGLGLSTGNGGPPTFNPQTVGPPHWAAASAPALNPIGQFLAPGQQQQQQHPISLQNATTGAYGMTGQPLMSVPQPGGFLVGGSNSNASPPQFLHSPSFVPQAESRSPMRPSAFEDHSRLELDIAVMDKLVEVTSDASVLVRYEATIGLARAVGKYIEAFVVVASGLVSATSRSRSSASSRRSFPIPRGLDRRYLNHFEDIWRALRNLQHEDPFPSIAKAANEIVSVVHEHLLRFRMEVEKAESSTSEDIMKLHPKKLANAILAGIDEEINNDTAETGHLTPLASSLSPRKPELHELRRVASEFAMAHSPVESAARRAISTDDMPMHYILPTSEFYEWKKKTFDLMLDVTEDDEELDPLSPSGAALVYQQRRNAAVQESGARLAKEFEVLAPKAPKPSIKTIESLFAEDEEEGPADQEIGEKKDALKMRETKIITNNDGKMTSMLAFHPFEDVIMACGANDNLSLWSTDTAKKLTTINNGNPSPSRMTYSTWINEESSSLFLVGCDDGSIRIWGDLLESNGDPSSAPPCIVSSFHAASMKPGQAGRSGLVCEWQPFSGTLLTGGNSDFVTCWDMQSEKRFLQLETNSDSCITTMTTAWDYDSLGKGPNPHGYKGLGREVVLAGFSNGSMKIFDLRASRAVTDMTTSRPSRSRITGYSEHMHWIVSCAFTSYGNRYEFISGTTAGDIKTWDLRMSKSVRTFEAHRSGMTTMTVHSKVPLIATGTSSQFIKLFKPDGDMLQAFRYHEKMRSHRIGPVSALSFHRFKPLLATGATDDLIGIYSSVP